jgi:hypothetical protein
MAFRPTLRTQLWRPVTGAVDCGPRTWQHAIQFATKQHRNPGIDRLRTLARQEGRQTTNVYDADRVMDKLGLTYQRKVNASWDVAVDALRHGKGLHLCISYGVLNDLQSARSGDKVFRGGHSIWVQEIRHNPQGRRVALSYDPLYDGRRANIPDEPQWIRIETLRKACAVFAGHGYRFWGGIVPAGQTGGGNPPDDDETVIPADPDATPDTGTPFPPAGGEEAPDDSDDDDGDDDLEPADEGDDEP